MVSQSEPSFLRTFLLRNWKDPVINSGGQGISLNFPDIDFGPLHYIEFAEKALLSRSASARIDCVTHLKRAIECEMDLLFHVMGIQLDRRERNVPFKLSLVQQMGIVRSSSLVRLNVVRNEIEHDFRRPKLQNVQIYFDLASAFVAAVDGYIFKLAAAGVSEWQGDSIFLHDGQETVPIGIRGAYSPEERRTVFELRDADIERKVVLAVSDGWETFSFGVRIHHLLMQADHIISTHYARQQLRHLRPPTMRVRPRAGRTHKKPQSKRKR